MIEDDDAIADVEQWRVRGAGSRICFW